MGMEQVEEEEVEQDFRIRAKSQRGGGPKPRWGDHIEQQNEINDDDNSDVDDGNDILNRAANKYDDNTVITVQTMPQRDPVPVSVKPTRSKKPMSKKKQKKKKKKKKKKKS